MAMPSIAASGLAFRYGKRCVWEDVSLELSPGQIAFLTGENGSGKSTLMRCLAGLSKPAEGELFVLGRPFDASDRKLRSEVVFVGDTPSFYDDLTAWEHLKFLGAAGGGRFDVAKAVELAESFGLSRHLDLVPSSFSRGMRQKLAIVIAFASKASVILLDEPHAPLDSNSTFQLAHLAEESASSGRAVLMTCHHELAGLLPDVHFALDGGRLAVASTERAS